MARRCWTSSSGISITKYNGSCCISCVKHMVLCIGECSNSLAELPQHHGAAINLSIQALLGNCRRFIGFLTENNVSKSHFFTKNNGAMTFSIAKTKVSHPTLCAISNIPFRILAPARSPGRQGLVLITNIKLDVRFRRDFGRAASDANSASAIS